MRGTTDQPNQNWQSQMLPSLDDYIHAKKLRYQLIISRYTDDKRIMQTDWTRDTNGHTQPKVVISRTTFIQLPTPCKKTKLLPDSFQRYC